MPEKTKPGPTAARLKIEETDWEKAIGKAIRKPKPEGGWPDHRGRKQRPKREPDD